MAWTSGYFIAIRDVSQVRTDEQTKETSVFDYTVTAEPGDVRVRGLADLPNGVVLVGTLDRIGSGFVEAKEALVMNRLFGLEFGPDLVARSYLHDPQNALRPGVYRLSVEFNPAQQSPFAQEALFRSPFMKALSRPRGAGEEIDAAIIRLSKTFAIGTTAEQQEAQAREQLAGDTIRQQLHRTLVALANSWSRLQGQYQQERSKGGFSRADPRASEWETWSASWLQELKDLGEEARLYAEVSPTSPCYTALQALVSAHRQLSTMPDLYFEVLVNEKPPGDRDLQRAERLIQYALGDAMAQLGPLDDLPSPLKVESAKPIVVVTAPLVHVRSGPGMSYESIKQLRKDDVLDFLAEQGEWLQVQLGAGRKGWVHRSVATKRLQGDGTADDPRRVDAKAASPEKKPSLRLEPVTLSSTPVELIPRPTADEVRIYAEIEQQLRDVHPTNTNKEDRKAVEQRILQRLAEKYLVSPAQLWDTYLKVQGWEIKP
jgi:hypothetical protein